MNIVNNIDWNVDRGIGAEVCRGVGGWVDSDVGGEVVSGDGDGVELEVVYKVGYDDDESDDKGIKCDKYGVDVGVCCILVFCVGCGSGAGAGSVDGITFIIHDGYNMCSSDGSFDGSNNGKLVSSLIY